MEVHYFQQETVDKDDIFLRMAQDQGYVPKECLLGGMMVMGLVNSGMDPCEGCLGPRERCKGRKKIKEIK